jgi:hypothetical protein
MAPLPPDHRSANLSIFPIFQGGALKDRADDDEPAIVEWTPRLVAAFLADAAEVLHGLHEVEGHEALANCPKLAHPGQCMHTGVRGTAHFRPCSPRAMAQVQTTLRWLQWLDDDVQCLAWDRANGRPWKAVAYARGIDRSTAWRRWTCAMTTISARLNAANDATLLQHREARRPPDDPVD